MDFYYFIQQFYFTLKQKVYFLFLPLIKIFITMIFFKLNNNFSWIIKMLKRYFYKYSERFKPIKYFYSAFLLQVELYTLYESITLQPASQYYFDSNYKYKYISASYRCYSFRLLACIYNLTLFTCARTNFVIFIPNQVLRFFNHEICLL